MISNKFDPFVNVHNFAVIRPSKQVHPSLDKQVFVVDARKLHEASKIRLPFEDWWYDSMGELGLIAKVDYFQEGDCSLDESDQSWTPHLKLYAAYAITYLMRRQNRIYAEVVLFRANPQCNYYQKPLKSCA